MLTSRGWCLRVALLEKLGTVPEATFDDADLHQLYQAYVLLDPPGAQMLHFVFFLCALECYLPSCNRVSAHVRDALKYSWQSPIYLSMPF